MLRVYLTQAEEGHLGGQDRSLISAFALCLGGIGFTARQLFWPWCDHCKGSGRGSKHGNVALYFLKGASTAASAAPAPNPTSSADEPTN